MNHILYNDSGDLCFMYTDELTGSLLIVIVYGLSVINEFHSYVNGSI